MTIHATPPASLLQSLTARLGAAHVLGGGLGEQRGTNGPGELPQLREPHVRPEQRRGELVVRAADGDEHGQGAPPLRREPAEQLLPHVAADRVRAGGRGQLGQRRPAAHVPQQVERAGAKRILGFHICDWLVPTTDLLLDRGMMGDGVIDLRGIREAVEAVGYAGYAEVEIFSRDWWARPLDEVLGTCIARHRAVV